MQERIDMIREAVDSIEQAADDTGRAYWYDMIRDLSLEGLRDTGLKVVQERMPFEDEEVSPLRYGWASTPGEVEVWCQANGFSFVYGARGAITLSFEGKPADKVREALNASGWRYVKSSRSWEHKAFGQYGKSEKVAAARAAVDETIA